MFLILKTQLYQYLSEIFLFALVSDEPEVFLPKYSQTAILHAAHFWRVVNHCFPTHRVVGVGHGVERPHGERELVEDVEVGVVLGLDEATQELLVRCAQVLLVSHLYPVLSQHGHSLRVRQDQTMGRGEGLVTR